MQPEDNKEPPLDPPPAIPDHQLLRYIGRGSYGAVWLARSSLGIYRAVKIVYRKSFSDDRPFEREWSGIRRFEPISRSHEGFVDVLHVGINEEAGYFYYVMELGDDQKWGQEIEPANYAPRTLKQEINIRGRLPASECLKLGLALGHALDELHKVGLVHRDIKPANIIFVNGVPKLADIGLVAEFKDARSFVGTEGFIPPEGPGSPRADVYGLGKTLYEASTGNDRNKFPDLPTLIDQVPEREKFLELNEVLLRACNPEASLRYETARDMYAELLVLVNGKSVRRLRLLERRLSLIKRVVATSVVVAAVASAVVYGVYHQRKAALEVRQRTAGASVAYGIQAMNAGDYLGALPFFAESLRLESGELDRNTPQRLRFGSILGMSPKLTQLWFGAGPVVSSQFSPDGKQVLLSRSGGDAEIRDVQSGRLRLLKSPPTLINSAYSPDGYMLVTVSQNSEACIWDAVHCTEVRRLPHPCPLWCARFSPDGLQLVTAASDGMARIWNVRTGTLAQTMKHEDAIVFADFSHDGRRIVTASRDSTARLWDAQSGEPAGAALKHGAWVTHAAFSPDGRELVTGCLDRKARVWNTSTGRQVLPDLEHPDAVESAVYSPDGRFLLTACRDGIARLWRTDNHQPASANPMLRHPAALTSASFSPDCRCVLTACADGSARIWDLAGSGGKPLTPTQDFSRDGSRYLTVQSNCVQVCDSLAGQSVSPPIVFGSRIQQATLSRDGRFLLTLCRPNSETRNYLVQVRDLATGQAQGPGILFSNAPAGLSLSAPGDRLVIFSGNEVQTWNVLTGSPLSPRLFHKQPVSRSFFSPEGERVVTVSGTEVRVWDASSGRAVFAPLTHPQPVQTAELSADERYLAVGCSDNLRTACYAQVYNAKTGHPASSPLPHAAGVLSVAFSPDSRRVATASADFTAVVWDIATGRPVSSPLQHENQVREAAFSLNGRQVITASADKTARVWDVESGEPITPPLRHLWPLAHAQFVGDAGHLLTIDERRNGRIWKLSGEGRSSAMLCSLARLISSGTSPGAGASSEPLEVFWERLHSQHPEDFRASAEDIIAWHEFAAQESELQMQWTAAAFHLKRLHALLTADQSITQRLAKAQEQLQSRN